MPDGKDSLNPLDDLKAAGKVLRSLHPDQDIARALAASARVLEPTESDLRVVVPESLPSDAAGSSITEDEDRPAFNAPPPGEIERRKQHRGY